MKTLSGLWLISILIFTTSALGQSVRGVQSKIVRPIAPRGGVMLLPLTAQRQGANWPQTLELRLADGRIVTGQVAWIHRINPRQERRWTDDPRQMDIRGIERSDDSSALSTDASVGPVLLARLPLDGAGRIKAGSQVLQPLWCDMPQNSSHGPVMKMTSAPDRPDPESPFEFWRWALLADRMKMRPPTPHGDEIQKLAAEHYAAIWQIGLERLAAKSFRIASQCQRLLTQICIDRRQPFAAWIADPVQEGLLLARLLDFDRTDSEILSSAVDWVDQQVPLVIWPESEFGEQIRLLAFTPSGNPVMASVRWQGSNEPPIAAQIEPGVLTKLHIERPPLPDRLTLDDSIQSDLETQILEIESRSRRLQMHFKQRIIVAGPPGIFLQQFSPPLTLADVQSQTLSFIEPERGTSAHIRRLFDRWEVFFDCRRPMNSIDHPPTVPQYMSSLDELRGYEAVTILLGSNESDDEPDVWLTVPETGWTRVVRGKNDGTLQVHKKSFRDRWYARVVLPDVWFSAEETYPARIGCIRSHGDSLQLETAPSVCPPWRTRIAPIEMDLSQWDRMRR